MVEGVGFEPTYAMRPDLQSGAFNHSATPPNTKVRLSCGAFTYEVCQLLSTLKP